MRLESLIAIMQALNSAQVRFLVAGGVAVNLHGYVRATQGLDLVVSLSEENARAAMQALSSLGYRPQVPVAIEEFADSARREEWQRLRNMQVFSLISDRHPETTVDIFVTEPFAFDDEYRMATVYQIAPELEVRAVRPETLIAMKLSAGRARDHDDVTHLRWIVEERGRNDDDH